MQALLKPNINWLAIFIPVSFALAYIPALKNEVALFICGCLGMLIVSVWIGNSTEQLAAKIGPTWGGMLNAAFGNLPELIFGLIALTKGLGSLVKAAWTGAIIGNMLLVLGISMAVGGIRHGEQRFPVDRANNMAAGLLIASVALVLPTIYEQVYDQVKPSAPNFTDDISLLIATFLLLAYITDLIYTVFTARVTARAKAAQAKLARESSAPSAPSAPESEPEETSGNTRMAIVVLLISSVLIAFLSDYVSDSVNGVKDSLGLSDLFLGVIVIAAIGNMAALFSAASMAIKDKMDIAFEIGMSASNQIALLVVPVLVMMSYVFGKPVNIRFSLAQVAVLFGAVLITTQIVQDGKCNWLNGIQMLILYALIAVLFFFLPF
ncbi:MAG: calcium/proton exchanger [Xenococcaceae cyanobacterium]